MPGNRYASIQNPRMYRALRRAGYDKTAAARISNARTPGRAVEKAPNYGARAGETIVGNLARGEGGQFTSAGSGGGGAKPATQPDRRTQRQQRATDRRDQRLASDEREAATRAEEDARLNAAATPKERAAIRRAIAAARRERAAMRRAERLQADRAEQNTRTQEDAEDRARAEADAAAPKKPPKGGGGGGGKAKPSAADKRAAQQAERAQTATTTAATVGLSGDAVTALRNAAEGRGGAHAETDRLGLTANGEATDQGRRALGALERGDVRGYQAAVQDARSAQQRQADRQTRQAERDTKRQTAAQRRQAAQAARDRARADRDQAARDAVTQRETRLAQMLARRTKALPTRFFIRKTAAGWRWLGISSSAYEDKDGEWVSQAALLKAVQRGDTTQDRGDLRFWHTPIVIGTCDFQAAALNGRFLVESGLITLPGLTEKTARALASWEMSIGFSPLIPPQDRRFDDIDIRERSITPPGKASNRLTAFAVHEETTAMDDMKLKALIDLIGEQSATDLLTQLQTKAADADAAGLIAKADAAPEPAAVDVAVEEVTDAAETDDMLLTDAEIQRIADAVSAAIMGQLDGIQQKMTAMDEELKGRGYSRMKEAQAAVTQEAGAREKAVADLRTEIAGLQARIKELESGQPAAAGFRPTWAPETVVSKEQAAALGANGTHTDPIGDFLAGFKL